MRRFARLVSAAALLGLTLLFPRAAIAHSSCDAESPKDGSTVQSAPLQVSCSYSEPPTQGSTMWIVDACGRRADDGRVLVVASKMSVGMASSAPSLYTVYWKATSQVDSHHTVGQWTFTVAGTPAPCPASGGSASSPSPAASSGTQRSPSPTSRGVQSPQPIASTAPSATPGAAAADVSPQPATSPRIAAGPGGEPTANAVPNGAAPAAVAMVVVAVLGAAMFGFRIRVDAPE